MNPCIWNQFPRDSLSYQAMIMMKTHLSRRKLIADRELGRMGDKSLAILVTIYIVVYDEGGSTGAEKWLAL